jgi:peptidoglycan hydrolase-like protein with peptidoglycan-binding domain
VRRRVTLPVSLVAAAIAGVVVTVAVGGGSPAPAAPAPLRVGTATVLRTDLSTKVLTGGTLGYAPARPVVNQLTGTYTWLPAAGRTIRAGRPLYRVDDQSAILMIGGTPAWRPFTLGMTAGPDVTELQANLIALGDATGLLSAPTGYFDLLTADAVQRWQAAEGYPVTGQIALGQIAFLPAAIRVGALSAAPGQDALPGQAPYQVTTSRRTVSVPLNPELPPVAVGEQVSIILPSNAATRGKVTAVGPAPLLSGSASSGSSSSSDSSGSSPGSSGSAVSQDGASMLLTVTPDRPGATGSGADIPVQVAIPIQSVRQVLAVPVSALLALAGGGYGLEVVTPSGAHRLVGVTTGIFAGGRVQVSGTGIAAGTKVVVAQ